MSHQMQRYIGQSLDTEISVPVELGTPLDVNVFTSLKAPQTPYCWDIMEASLHRQDQLLSPFLVPLLFLADEGWG